MKRNSESQTLHPEAIPKPQFQSFAHSILRGCNRKLRLPARASAPSERASAAKHLLFILTSVFCLLTPCSRAQTLVQISDTLYNADGTKAAGRIVISWNPFTAASGETLDGGTKLYTIPATGINAGKVDVSLAPNAGASPSGTSYRARYYLANGANYTETWVVPATGPVKISDVRVSVVPSPTVLFNAATQLTGAVPIARGGTALSSIGSANLCLKVNSAGTALEYGSCAAGGTGITSLNTLTAATQTFSIPGTSGTAPNWSSAGFVHTLNLPLASAAAVSAGLISKADYDAFSAKESALTFSAPLSRAVNTVSCPDCEVTGNKNQANGYAGLDGSAKVAASQLQEVIGVSDLSDFSAKSGAGTTAIGATLTSPASNDLIEWDGSGWVNTASAAKADALTNDPGDCPANNFATAIAASGNLTCAQPAAANLSDGSSLVKNNAANIYSGTTTQDFGASTTTLVLPKKGDPGSPAAGEVWVNGAAIKVRDNGGTPATRTLADTGSAQTLSSKTLTTPAIGDFSSATHNHQTSSGGGTLDVAAVASGILGAARGGTGNGFTKFSGPATSEKTFTLPDASATVLTTNAAVTPAQGGAGANNTATSGRYLKGDGTNFVTSSGSASGAGSCTNQAVTALNSDAAPTCSTVTSAYVDSSIVTPASTSTLTNKTLDAEGAGNSVSLAVKYWIPAAGCDNASAATSLDIPTSNGPSKTCFGTSPQRFGALDFADGASALTSTAHLTLPADWTSTGGGDIKFVWFSGSTSANSAVWTLATACIADAEDLIAPAFNTTQTVSDANNSTANTRNSATITGFTTTGCAGGETLFLRIGRDPTNGSDTLSATTSLIGVEVTLRRAM